MRRKNLLWIFLTTLIATATITIQTPTTTAQELPTIAVSPLIIDTRNLKQVGDTFSMNITIANVQNLWGYQFSVFYNTSVIYAIDYAFIDLDTWTKPQPSEIGINYVALARGTYDNDETGVTTVDPLPVARIDFMVNGTGTTSLTMDPGYARLAHVAGASIEPFNVVGGRFSNTQILETHDVAVTEASVSKTTALPGDTIEINGVIANLGGFTENVTVTAKYNQTQIGDPQTITNLQKDASQPVSFEWHTAGIEEDVYQVTVEATIEIDDDISNNIYIAGSVTLGGDGGGGLPIDPIYIGAGVVILIVVIIAVYALRARK